MKKNELKIALLANPHFSDYSLRTIQTVLEDDSLNICACIIYNPPPKSTRKKLINSWKRGRRTSILVIIIELIIKKTKQLFGSKKSKYYNTKDFFKSRKTSVLVLKKLYTTESIESIRNLEADCLILFGYHGIVKTGIIELFPKGVLSYHYGNMRKYRGQPAAFWELYHHEKEMGVTVQKISPGIDNGEPIEEMTVQIKDTDTIHSLSHYIDIHSPAMLYNALKKIQNNYQPEKIEYGPLYTVPNLFQWLWVQIILPIRRIKSVLKSKTIE